MFSSKKGKTLKIIERAMKTVLASVVSSTLNALRGLHSSGTYVERPVLVCGR